MAKCLRSSVWRKSNGGSNYLFPNAGSFPGVLTYQDAYQVHWHVPVDDHSHWKYVMLFTRSADLDKSFLSGILESGVDGDGYSQRTRHNRYAQDRAEMANEVTFAGFGRNIQLQDLAVVEQLAPLAERDEGPRLHRPGGRYSPEDTLVTTELSVPDGISWREVAGIGRPAVGVSL